MAVAPVPGVEATCDTLHAHTQVLGKLAVELAPPEPQLQHAALRLTARGWETAPAAGARMAPGRSWPRWTCAHQAVVEHSDGRRAQDPARARTAPVGEVTREVLAAVARLAGVEIDPTPQEVAWTVPLDEDDEHARYDPEVASYFAAATQAALVLAAFRRPYRGRSTPVNAWWGRSTWR